MAEEYELHAILRYLLDKRSLDEVKKGTLSVEEALKRVEAGVKRVDSRTKELDQTFMKIREQGERLSGVSSRIALIGTAVSGPLLLAATRYVQMAGAADRSSQRWLTATERLERSQMRLGRVTAQAIVPALEKASELAERISDFAEDHPLVMQAGLAMGAGTAGIGALGMMAGQLTVGVGMMGRLILQARMMMGGTAAASAAGGLFTPAATGAAAGGMAKIAGVMPVFLAGASAAAGATIGIAISQALGYKGTFLQGALDVVSFPIRLGLTANVLAASGLRELGNLTGSEALRRLAENMGRGSALIAQDIDYLRDSLDKTAPKARELATAIDRFGDQTEAALFAFVSYQKQLTEADRRYNQQRGQEYARYQNDMERAEKQYLTRREEIFQSHTRTVEEALRDYETAQARALQQHNERVSQLMADFAQSEAQAEKEHYASRTQQARDHSLAMARLEEDHQRNIRRMREDHDDRMADLIRTRDARAILQEMHDYEKARTRSEEDYRTEIGRRDADYAQQLADQEAAFAEQRTARREAFAEQLMALKAQLQQERAEIRMEYEQRMQEAAQRRAEALTELQDQYDSERSERERQYRDRLQQLEEDYRDEKALIESTFDETLMMMQTTSQRYLNWLKARTAEFESYLMNPPGLGRTGSVWGYAAGGYASGLIMTGERGREFVLDAPTTRSLERELGVLSQEKMRASARSFCLAADVNVNVGGAAADALDRESLQRVVEEYLVGNLREFAARMY